MGSVGRHAQAAPSWREGTVTIAAARGAVAVARRVAGAAGAAVSIAGSVTLRAAAALARLCARLTVAGWRQLGTGGRLIVVAAFCWPATELAQGTDMLPGGWIVTGLVSGALVAVCLLAWAAVNAFGRWRWRRTGGRAWNRREPVTVTAARNSERLDDHDERLDGLEQRVYEILTLMDDEVAAAQGARAGAHLTVVREELHHEAS